MSEVVTGILLAVLSIFPFSFLAFAWSQRVILSHESRVGKARSVSQFVFYLFRDALEDIRQRKSTRDWFFLIFQVSILFLLSFDLQLVFYLYLFFRFFVLAHFSPLGEEGVKRIQYDRRAVASLLATLLAVLSSYGVFVYSKDTSLNALSWNPLLMIQLPMFLLAGAIDSGESPFSRTSKRRDWFDAVPFYVWCALASVFFLGAGQSPVVMIVAPVILFVGCRLLLSYFPRFEQKDLLRLSVFYFIPVTVSLWFATLLFVSAIFSGGGSSV